MIPHAVIADILKAVEPLIELTKWRNLRRDWPADGPWKVSVTNAQVWELHDAFAALSALAPEGLAGEAATELARARSLFPRFNGPHEGYAVLLEELDELWVEVKA